MVEFGLKIPPKLILSEFWSD